MKHGNERVQPSDNFDKEVEFIPREFVKCDLHNGLRTVEVITGNTNTGVLHCGHVWQFHLQMAFSARAMPMEALSFV
jgi:hypothetical protein